MSIPDSPYHIFALERQDFLKTALAVFRYQAEHCAIYKQYIALLKIDLNHVERLEEIPFLPIQFFKTHKIVSKKQEKYLLFESSATTGQTTAKHYVADEDLYKKSMLASFEAALGPVKDLVILGLLPHYLERQNSSLVYMVAHLMKCSGRQENGFFLDKEQALYELLLRLEKNKRPTVLFGVTFALLDFAEKYSLDLSHVRIIETGGMKGRKIERTRAEVHAKLQSAFGPQPIYSEYGMAELLSQSYLGEDKKFTPPVWKKVLTRDVYDPLDTKLVGKGALNIIDLANVHSCSFLATADVGAVYSNGQFEVLGRLDASEIRGCNLLLEA